MRKLAPILLPLALLAPAAYGAAPVLDLQAVPVAAPTFSSLPAGWRSFTTPGDLTPRGAQTGALAVSWPFRLATVGGPAGAMPRNAVLVTVSLFRLNAGGMHGSLCDTTPTLAGHPGLRALPLRLPATTSATLEGTSWPEYRIFGRLDGSYDFEVRVDIGARDPSPRLRRLAERVVSAIVLPRWPRPAAC
jgi:hypothetical protein